MKISQLTLGTIGANDFVPVSRSGTNYKLNLSDSISAIITTKVSVATSKTLTVNNTITLSGTDGATLNIGAGGTLGSAAYTSSSAYAASSHSHVSADISDAVSASLGAVHSGKILKLNTEGGFSVTVSGTNARSFDGFASGTNSVGVAGVNSGDGAGITGYTDSATHGAVTAASTSGNWLFLGSDENAEINVFGVRREDGALAFDGLTVLVTGPDSSGQMATTEWVGINYVPLGGGTMSGTLVTPKVTESSAAQSWNASTVLNFNSTNKWIILGTLTGDTTITTSNRGLDKELTVIILADASTRALTFSESWTWIGGNPPANLAAGKRAVLSLRCVGSDAADVLASWAVQP